MSDKLQEIVEGRHQKEQEVRDAGLVTRPSSFRTDCDVVDVVRSYPSLQPGDETGDWVSVAGRVVAARNLGRIAFVVVRQDATDLQLFCAVKLMDEQSNVVLENVDVGDWVGAYGQVVSSSTGELSVKVEDLHLLGKSYLPMPDKHDGFTDVEQRYRQREVDMTVNVDVRRTFDVRHRTMQTVRKFMLDSAFVEVETPLLHPIPGGAAARPFVTHHNSLDTDLYLRVAPELYLKRLVAAGMSRVFEIGRSFRNEGLSPRHNPEFTMMESYQAFVDYSDVMQMAENLLQTVVRDITGSDTLTYQGQEISFHVPFRRVTMLDAVQDAADTNADYDSDIARWQHVCGLYNVEWQEGWTAGHAVNELYEQLVEPHLEQPTFVTNHPTVVSPLARPHDYDPNVTERFELVIAGREIANAFSELVDPAVQRERFERQVATNGGTVDEAYLRAMEFGMPPIGGFGIGLDRLVMLLADVPSIRDVLLFPTMRPER